MPEPWSEPQPTVEVAPRPAALAPRTQHVSGELETGKARDQGLAAERKWVEMARTALARGRVDGALAALRHHARAYPSGQLTEERDSLLIQSLVAKGDYAQARTQAARFDRQHPHSLFSPAIEQALQSIP
jgi:outer membrane protein assembly factor BamD (BamD/ComL family)